MTLRYRSDTIITGPTALDGIIVIAGDKQKHEVKTGYNRIAEIITKYPTDFYPNTDHPWKVCMCMPCGTSL